MTDRHRREPEDEPLTEETMTEPAAEHMPARGGAGRDDDLVIEFPGPPPREDPGTKDGAR